MLYNNEADSVLRCLESFSNSAKLAQEGDLGLGEVVFVCGDASETPVLKPDNEMAARAMCSTSFRFDNNFFSRNTGFGGGHNILAQQSREDFIIFINPDLVVAPFFLERLLAPFFRESNIGVVEGRQSPIEHPKYYDPAMGDTEWASGACFATDAALFKKLGGFDEETFFMYCEDVDYSWRVKAEGRRVVYQPAAVAYHPKRLTNGGRWSPSDFEVYHSALSSLMMAYKWSNDQRLRQLIGRYEKSPDARYRSALNVYRDRVKEGKVPQKLAASETVASFVGENYAPHRFGL